MQGRASVAPLPLMHVAVEAVWRCWRVRRDLLWVLLLPAISMVIIDLWRLSSETPRVMQFALILAEVVVIAFAAASCHRLFLLGPRAVPKLGVNGRQMREWIFAGLFFVLLAFMIALLVLITAIAGVPYEHWLGSRVDAATSQSLRTFAWVPACLVVSRLLLVLPARAVDAPITFRNAWRMSEGNGWRLALLIGALPWFLHIAEYTVADLFVSYTDYTIIRSVFSTLLLPLEVAFLSMSYRYLSRMLEPATQGAQETS
jgi:hypothetical protein